MEKHGRTRRYHHFSGDIIRVEHCNTLSDDYEDHHFGKDVLGPEWMKVRRTHLKGPKSPHVEQLSGSWHEALTSSMNLHAT